MTESGRVTATELEPLIEQASLGSREAARQFFESFLDTELVVVERFQSQTLSNSPKYPDDFFNILGITDAEKVIIPAFTRVEFIEEWSGQTFQHRLLTGAELLNLAPEEWWISLNPGEQGKDFSPWEISELKLGKEAIPQVLEENFYDESSQPLEVQNLADEEYKELVSSLSDYGKANKEIVELALLKEISLSPEGEKQVQLLLGVWVEKCADERREALESELESIAQKALIGGDPVSVSLGFQGEKNIGLSIFRKTTPFYIREKGNLISSLLQGFRKA